MNEDIKKRLTPVFQTIFNPAVLVTETLDASQVVEWDSLNHISLIVAIEEEFKCSFTTEELARMKNVGDLIEILRGKGK